MIFFFLLEENLDETSLNALICAIRVCYVGTVEIMFIANFSSLFILSFLFVFYLGVFFVFFYQFCFNTFANLTMQWI